METELIFELCLKNAGGDVVKLDQDLRSMEERSQDFIKPAELWDRNQLISKKRIVLVCYLLENPSGSLLNLIILKTYIVTRFLFLNLRTNPDILKGLIWTIQFRSNLIKNPHIKSILSSIIPKPVKYRGVEVPVPFAGSREPDEGELRTRWRWNVWRTWWPRSRIEHW